MMEHVGGGQPQACSVNATNTDLIELYSITGNHANAGKDVLMIDGHSHSQSYPSMAIFLRVY